MSVNAMTVESNQWDLMLAAMLHRRVSQQPTLSAWLLSAAPGASMMVPCDSPRERGDVQSKVAVLCRRKRIRASAVQSDDLKPTRPCASTPPTICAPSVTTTGRD